MHTGFAHTDKSEGASISNVRPKLNLMVENLIVCELSTVESHIRILGLFRLHYILMSRIFQMLRLMGTKKTSNLCHPIYYTKILNRYFR